MDGIQQTHPTIRHPLQNLHRKIYSRHIPTFSISLPFICLHTAVLFIRPSQLDTHLLQLITDQPAILVHIQVFEHGVHQRSLLLHVSLLALLWGSQHFGLHIQQHALQPVVLRHGACLACESKHTDMEEKTFD